MAKSRFEGRSCPACDAPLKAVSTNPSIAGTFKNESLVGGSWARGQAWMPRWRGWWGLFLLLVLACQPSQPGKGGQTAPPAPAEKPPDLADLADALEVSHEQCQAIVGIVEASWSAFGPDFVGKIIDEYVLRDPEFAGAREGLRLVEARLEAARRAPPEVQDLALDLYSIQKRECELAMNPSGMNLISFRSMTASYVDEFARKTTRLRFKAGLPARPAYLSALRSQIAAVKVAVERRVAAQRVAERLASKRAAEERRQAEEASNRDIREAAKRWRNPPPRPGLSVQHWEVVDGEDLLVRVRVFNSGTSSQNVTLRMFVRSRHRLGALAETSKQVMIAARGNSALDFRFVGLGRDLPDLLVEPEIR
jgi:hypothetical protein